MNWRNQKYQDLMALLSAQKRYGVLRCVRGEAGLHSRQTTMVSLFYDAVKAGDDEGALVAAQWVMKATDDIHLLPLLDDKGVLGSGEKKKEAEDAASRNREGEARALWKSLPEKREGRVRVQIAEDDSEWQKADFPAMLETRKFLLTQVVRRWRETKDEGEADQLFAWLCDLKFSFSEERNLLLSVVREEGTKRGFPPERAARQHLELTSDPRYRASHDTTLSEVARLLAIAWIRNSTDTQRVQFMHAVLPVMEFSKSAPDPVFALLNATAENLAGLARKVKILKENINPNHSWSGPKVTVAYLFARGMKSKPGRKAKFEVALTVEYGQRDFWGYSGTASQGMFKEEKAHEKFEELKGLVKAWQDTNGSGTCPVALKMVVPNKYKPEEPVFRRETTIA